jgi:hypothetical protein
MSIFNKRQQQKEKRMKKVLTWFIVVIMVLSLVGFLGGGSFGSGGSQTERYNGVRFSQSQQGITAKIDGSEYYFNFLPSQLEFLNIGPGVREKLQGPVLLMTYDGSSEHNESMAVVQFDMGRVLYEQAGRYVVPGIMDENEYDFPIIGCVNATAAEPVLAFVEGNRTAATLQNDCIIAESSTQIGFYQLRDRLLLEALGVFE